MAGILTDAAIKDALRKNDIHIVLRAYNGENLELATAAAGRAGECVDVGTWMREDDAVKDRTRKYYTLSHSQRNAASDFVTRRITSCGIDFRFDSSRRPFCVNERRHLEPLPTSPEHPSGGAMYEIPARATVTVATIEWFEFPPCICGLVQSKVSQVSDGIGHVSTTVDAVWNGELLITFTNLNDKPVHLCHGQAIGTLTLHRADQPTERTSDVTSDRNIEILQRYARMEADRISEESVLAKKDSQRKWFGSALVVIAFVLAIFVIWSVLVGSPFLTDYSAENIGKVAGSTYFGIALLIFVQQICEILRLPSNSIFQIIGSKLTN